MHMEIWSMNAIDSSPHIATFRKLDLPALRELHLTRVPWFTLVDILTLFANVDQIPFVNLVPIKGLLSTAESRFNLNPNFLKARFRGVTLLLVESVTCTVDPMDLYLVEALWEMMPKVRRLRLTVDYLIGQARRFASYMKHTEEEYLSDLYNSLRPVSGSRGDAMVPLPNLLDFEGVLVFDYEHETLESTRASVQNLLQARKEAKAVPLALQSLTTGPFYQAIDHPNMTRDLVGRWEIRFRVALP
jgi:hypothetical protein